MELWTDADPELRPQVEDVGAHRAVAWRAVARGSRCPGAVGLHLGLSRYRKIPYDPLGRTGNSRIRSRTQ